MRASNYQKRLVTFLKKIISLDAANAQHITQHDACESFEEDGLACHALLVARIHDIPSHALIRDLNIMFISLLQALYIRRGERRLMMDGHRFIDN